MAGLQLLRALHGAHAGNPAEAKDHAIQVVQVFGFDDEFDGGFAVLGMANIDGADVGVVVGDNGGQLS
jgi:hypothetical protein